MIKLILAATLAAPLLTAPAMAQSHPGAMPGMTMAASPANQPSTEAYRRAMKSMMEQMDVPYTGNADHDFVTGMLPHHQGAIDMARVELQYGRDPALQKLAREIIASQAKEQDFMRRWLAQHKLPAARP